MKNNGFGKTTIKDVAALAGVSIGTVSRAINNKGYLSESARQKVLQAVEKTGFVPNIKAHAMMNDSTPFIGVVVPEINNPYLSYLVAYIEKYLDAVNYSIMLCNNSYSSEKAKTFIDRLIQHNVKGLIMIATSIDDKAYLESIREKMYLICINTSIEGTDCINVADWQATFELTEYLIALGHHDIAYIGFNHASPPTMERLRGYKDAMMKHNIPLKEEYMLATDNPLIAKYTTRNKQNPANYLAAKLLDLPNPPTAIMAINDYYALSIYTECINRGMSVGRDLSIIGYDDIPLAQIVSPPMTSVHCDVDSIAYMATSTLIDHMNEKAGFHREPRSILVPGTIQHRASIAPPLR